jgi:malic enzyme
VAVITNGTAVLGLGNIGPLAAKPVMEGKGCLFKKFAGIDVFDIELAENDPDKLIDIIAALEPTLGGINLEDIKAPECFYIEQKLRERMNIPVFHDDQHGTAIISAAAIINGLKVVGKNIADVKLVVSGAGAAAIACLDLWCSLGFAAKNIFVCDSKGVIYAGRDENMEPNKARYAQKTECRTLADAIVGADVFLGLSAAGVLKQEMVKTMADKPLIFALANPTPEIMPELAKAVRPDCIIATGRSDYPNQVNNVLCFPFIFRGALDVGATKITEEMKLACVKRHRRAGRSRAVRRRGQAYGGADLSFGPDYLIPKPFDPRLIVKIAPAVAQAAMDSAAWRRARSPIDAYVQQPQRVRLSVRHHHEAGVYDGQGACPLSKSACFTPKARDERVLRAVRAVVDESLARPVLIGRPAVIDMRIEKCGLNLKAGRDFDVVNPVESDSALPRAVAGVLPPHGPRRRHPGLRPRGPAARLHPDRLHAAAPRRRRRAGLRHHRFVRRALPSRGKRHRAQARRQAVCRDERAAAAASVCWPSPTPTSMNCPRRRDRRDRRDGGRGNEALRHRAEGCAAVPFQLRQRPQQLGSRCVKRATSCASRCPTCSAMAKCTAIRPCRPKSAIACTRTRPSTARPTCWSCPTSTPPTSPSTCSRLPAATASRSARSCWARPVRCTS